MKRIPFTKEEIAAWPEGYKSCLECRELKALELFSLNNQGKFGRHSLCKECVKPISRLTQQNKRPENIMLKGALARARQHDLPFDITEEDLVIPTHCPILGLELSRGGDLDTSPSLDRIIPELGYTKGNIAIISNRANRIKNNAAPDELLKIAHWYYEQRTATLLRLAPIFWVAKLLKPKG